MEPHLLVGPISEVHAEDAEHKISADVDGAAVWFASDRALSANPDALACAFLIPAMAADRPLKLHEPVDATLLANFTGIAEIFHDWWNFSIPEVRAETCKRAPNGGTGMFFTAGVDSFFTLWRNRERIDYLINVHGFDIDLDDTDRFAQSSAAIRKVAEALSIEPIFVRTNLRDHPTFQAAQWEKTHIAALAAVGHVLSPWLRQVYVASSDVLPPYASHPDLDCLWSSNAIETINDEINISRLDKVNTIGHWPLAQRYLKVCWENRAKSLNCGECEKCVRTQAQLAAVGALDHCKTFPPGSLAERISALSPVSEHFTKQWSEVRDLISDSATKSAVNDLLARIARQNRFRRTERRLWRALSTVSITSKGMKAIDARLFGGGLRRAYYAILRLLHSY